MSEWQPVIVLAAIFVGVCVALVIVFLAIPWLGAAIDAYHYWCDGIMMRRRVRKWNEREKR